MDYPFITRVKISGGEASATAADLAAGLPTVLDGLSFSWGRSTSVDQPDIGSCTFTIREQLIEGQASTPMMDIVRPDATVEVRVDVTFPDNTTDERLVWAGVVTTVNGSPAGDQAIELSVTAVELAATLAEETIGDKPWPVQSATTRVNRILELARTTTWPAVIDPTIGDVQVSRVDVDAQPPLGLLHNIANSVGGVLWQGVQIMRRQVGTRPPVEFPVTYLWLEDPAERSSTRQFVINPTTGRVTIEPMTGDGMGGASIISAADLLRDPVTWTRDKTQEINSVDITWREQATDEEGQPTTIDRVVTRTQPGSTFIKKMSVDTDLTTEIEADRLAARWVSVTGQTQGWTASGLSIDTRILHRDDPDVTDGLTYLERLDSIIALLDAIERMGRLITIVGLPDWAPGGGQTSVYVEGGTYTLQDGKWLLDLNVVDATGQGKTAAFGDFGGTNARPVDFIGIRGVDTWGVAGPRPSFYDMPRDSAAYVSAHRGGSYIVPEGTRVGRLNALDLGMQVIDGGDIHATSDGVLFDMHDNTVDRTTNLTGPISDLTSTQLRQGVLDCSVWFGGGWADQPITSISDTLDDLGGKAYVTLEIKSGVDALENCRRAVDMITARGLGRQTLIASFTGSLLQPAIEAGIETMLLGTTGTAIPGSGLLSRGIRYFGGSTSMTSETAKAIADEGIRVVTYSTEQHADVNKYKNGPSGHLYGYISDDPHYLKEHVRGTYSYRLASDPFDSLTWYHGMQPDNFNVHPNYRGSFAAAPGGAYYCVPVSSTRRAILQGWACPLPSPTAYTVTFEVDFLNHATSAGAALVFGCPDDAPFTGDNQAGGGVGPAPGYVLFLFSSGLMRLFRRDPGQLPVQIGEFDDNTVITPGDPTRISVRVTPTDITATKITNPDATFTATDATYRGGYMHLLANRQGAAAGARWRNVTIT